MGRVTVNEVNSNREGAAFAKVSGKMLENAFSLC